MPAISQYVLIFIAVTFTWLMGLMGYVRSGLRQHWHVYGVIRDTSPDAFTPTLGFATQVVSVTVLVFFLLIGFVFWLASLHDRPDYGAGKTAGHGHGSGAVSPELAAETPGEHGGRRDGPAPRQDRPARPRRHGVLHLCRPAGAAEGSASAAGNDHPSRPDHRRHGHGRPPDHGGQGALPDLPHDRQVGGAPVPRSRRRRRPRGDARAGPDRRRVLRAVALRPRQLHRRRLQPGHAGHQQAPDRPHRSGDPLRDRLPPDARRHGDGDAPDESRLLHGAGRDAGAPAAPDQQTAPGEQQPLIAPPAQKAAPGAPAAPVRRRKRQPRCRLRPPRRRDRSEP